MVTPLSSAAAEATAHRREVGFFVRVITAPFRSDAKRREGATATRRAVVRHGRATATVAHGLESIVVIGSGVSRVLTACGARVVVPRRLGDF
jgi:hypothetical protein